MGEIAFAARAILPNNKPPVLFRIKKILMSYNAHWNDKAASHCVHCLSECVSLKYYAAAATVMQKRFILRKLTSVFVWSDSGVTLLFPLAAAFQWWHLSDSETGSGRRASAQLIIAWDKHSLFITRHIYQIPRTSHRCDLNIIAFW